MPALKIIKISLFIQCIFQLLIGLTAYKTHEDPNAYQGTIINGSSFNVWIFALFLFIFFETLTSNNPPKAIDLSLLALFSLTSGFFDSRAGGLLFILYFLIMFAFCFRKKFFYVGFIIYMFFLPRWYANK